MHREEIICMSDSYTSVYMWNKNNLMEKSSGKSYNIITFIFL